jgi:hypothetical protein
VPVILFCVSTDSCHARAVKSSLQLSSAGTSRPSASSSPLRCATTAFRCGAGTHWRSWIVSRVYKFWEVSALVYLLYKLTVESTFENVCLEIVDQVEMALQLGSLLPGAGLKNLLCVCVCVCLCVCACVSMLIVYVGCIDMHPTPEFQRYYIYVCIHTHTQTHTYTHAHTHTHVCMFVCVCLCVCVCTYKHLYPFNTWMTQCARARTVGCEYMAAASHRPHAWQMFLKVSAPVHLPYKVIV